MAQTLSTVAAFTALLSACLLGSVSAGIQYTTGIEYPGFTGVIPACVSAPACQGLLLQCLHRGRALCSNAALGATVLLSTVTVRLRRACEGGEDD